MKYALVLLIALISYSSCKKKTVSYTISGVITDQSFAILGEGVLIQLYAVPAGGGTGLNTLVGSVVTGPDGTYTFTVGRTKKVEKYQLFFSKDNYFPVVRDIYTKSLETTNTYTDVLSTKSWVRLTFHNTDPTDKVRIVRTNGKTDCEECCDYYQFELYGITDTTFYCINDGNTLYSYYWFLLQTTTNGEKSVTTVPFDTTDIVLNF